MESRYLDRLPLRPPGPGQQTLHPLVVGSYQNEGVYSQAKYATSLVITYHPVVGMDQPGQVMFGLAREGQSPSPTSIAALAPKSATPVWKSATLTIPKDLLQTQEWLRMADPCAYLVYWWSTPTPPGYFTFTCTIKAVNPFRDTLPPTPEPTGWPTTTLRGQPGPCLYKYGFATCYAQVAASTLASAGAWAPCIGGKLNSRGILSNTTLYDKVTSPACPNFTVLFPGYRVCMVVYAMDMVIMQSKGGILTDGQMYAKNAGNFVGITARWVNREELYQVYPKPTGNKSNNDFIMAWSVFDYTEQDIWADWSDPAPTGIMVAYYAIPPGLQVHGSTFTGLPCITYYSNDAMNSDPIEVPVMATPQWGVFNTNCVQRG